MLREVPDRDSFDVRTVRLAAVDGTQQRAGAEHPVGQAEPPLLDQPHHGHSRDRLGNARHAEQMAPFDRRSGGPVGHAVPLR